jgi:deoxyribodipyrimidine photo-lyase
MARTVVCWFRRDLRVGDNPALVAAAADGHVVPLFVIDPAFTTRAGAPRRHHLAASLRALDASIGRALVVRSGDSVAVVTAVASEVGAPTVFAATDSGPYGRTRDDAVAARLALDGRALVRVGTPYAVAPGTLRPASVPADAGRGFAVFTPFRRAWEAAGWDAPLAPPSVSWRGAPDVAGEGPPAAPHVDASLPSAGEAAAHERLDGFLAHGLDGYAQRRNLPGVDGTSRLSVHLRFGELHPRQALAALGDMRDHATFRSELAWREFYADVLHHRPASAWSNLQRRMDAMVVDTRRDARVRFERWTTGTTGYPIVDAGQRQLLREGWVHNRVRMIVASFLVKDLHLPWQWGARHYLRHLVDGDLASNSHGWQWVAGTGTDAAPYYRIFNPVAQSERFDPDGEYIRRWVPELADVAGGAVHTPWASRQGLPPGYPAPVVDHADERAEALRRYAATGDR